MVALPVPGSGPDSAMPNPGLNEQHESLGCRSKLNLIRMAIELNVAANLAAPFLVECLIRQDALMEESCGSPGRSDHFTNASQRAIGLRSPRHWELKEYIGRRETPDS